MCSPTTATTQKKGVSGLFCVPPTRFDTNVLRTRKLNINCTSVGVFRVISTKARTGVDSQGLPDVRQAANSSPAIRLTGIKRAIR